jgi:hypothetical protein
MKTSKKLKCYLHFLLSKKQNKMSNSQTSQILEKFRDDPRTTKMRLSHTTSVHIAVLVSRGKIIAEATNRIGSRSKGCGYSNCTIHAEKNVVKVLGDYTKLRDTDMYVMRSGRGKNSNNFMNSKPCSDCEYFLKKCMSKYGLRNVYYTS